MAEPAPRQSRASDRDKQMAIPVDLPDSHRPADDRREMEAILDIYKAALGLG